MNKFLILYKAPNAVIDEWMKKTEQGRKGDDTKMMDAWKQWMSANASKFTDRALAPASRKSCRHRGEGCTQRHHDVTDRPSELG